MTIPYLGAAIAVLLVSALSPSSWTVQAHAEPSGCFSGPTLVENNAYMTWEMQNKCGGAAVVNWSLRHEGGRVETGRWRVSACSTSRDQYFKGEYKFDVTVEGESKTCLTKEDVAKRELDPKIPSGRALPRALQQANTAANDARLEVQEALKKEAQRKANEEADKKRFKELASVPSPNCQNAIEACEQRAGTLSNLKQDTQSQCMVYCQLLQIENCNPASSTIRQAAQACTAGAERDQKDATAKAKAVQSAARRQKAATEVPLDHCEALRQCDAGCGPASDATATCWNSCVYKYGRC